MGDENQVPKGGGGRGVPEHKRSFSNYRELYLSQVT